MATITSTWTDSTLNSTITVQVTYTITQYNDYAKLVITKHEIKSTKPVTYTAFSGNIYYYDSSGNWTSTSIPLSAVTTSTSYKTRWSGTKTVNAYKSTTNRQVHCCEVEIPIGTVTAYTLTYSASGASGIPSPTTKYYGYAVKLSSVTPTKTGYTFAGWKSSYDNVVYPSSATYPKGNNANATLTAQWTANVYTVSYKANGGSGTVANTSKTYDVSANFSNGAGFSRKITSSSGVTNEYVLSSWNTKADGSGTTYQLGSAIPNITANLTVYAIWTLTYIYPYFSNYEGYRTATDDPDDTTYTDSGEYPYITFDFTGFSNDGGSTYSAPSCTILVNNEDTYTPTLTLTTSTGGSLAYKITSPYSADAPHTVVITLSDSNTPQHAYSANFTIMSATYPIDLWANRNDDEVYMGVMHPYVPNQKLTLTDTVIDGDLQVSGHTTLDDTTQINEVLTLYRESTTEDNYPAGIIFTNKDTTTEQVYSSVIYAYNDHGVTSYGHNMVISPRGNMFIGAGEAAEAHYNLYKSNTGETFYLTADGSVCIQANGNTIANRLGFYIDSSHNVIPCKADTATNNVGNLGTSSYKWANIYATNLNGTAIPAITAGTAGTSSATSGSSLAVPYVTYNAKGMITAAGTHTHTISGFLPSSGGTLSGKLTISSGGADITGGVTVKTSSLVVSVGSCYIPNNKGYYSYDTGGTARVLATISDSNNYLFGSGSYSASAGASYFEGYATTIRSRGGNGVTLPSGSNAFRPVTANATANGTTTYYWTRSYVNTAEWVKSDRKAKDVLGDLDFSEDLIMNLKPVQFMLKDSDHRRIHMGFIAQDAGDVAKKINKNLSFIIADYVDPEKGEYLGEEVNDEELTWGLSYTELIAPTIKVVQDQQRKIDKLERRIEQLEKGVQI